MKVKCAVKGCKVVIETDSLPHSVSKNFKYICSGRIEYGDGLSHTECEQFAAMGRKCKSEKEPPVNFQDYAFDPRLKKLVKPHSVTGGGEGKYESPNHE